MSASSLDRESDFVGNSDDEDSSDGSSSSSPYHSSSLLGSGGFPPRSANSFPQGREGWGESNKFTPSRRRNDSQSQVSIGGSRGSVILGSSSQKQFSNSEGNIPTIEELQEKEGTELRETGSGTSQLLTGSPVSFH